MTIILNLTQHAPTPEQEKAGVVSLSKERQEELKKLLNFEELPKSEEIEERANLIVDLAIDEFRERGISEKDLNEETIAMIGGASFLLSHLEVALEYRGITPVYAFSKRISVEKTLPTGEVVKTSQFKHLGFVEV